MVESFREAFKLPKSETVAEIVDIALKRQLRSSRVVLGYLFSPKPA